MKKIIKKIFIILFLILIWTFSLFELWNLSALYKDQVETGKFFLSIKDPPATIEDYANLQQTANEINSFRVMFLIIFLGIPITLIVRTIYLYIKNRKKVKSLDNASQ